MYTIVSGTNRTGSYSHKVAREYQRLLKIKGIDAEIISLVGMNLMERDNAFEQLEKEIIIPTDNFIFILPEYNGSFPGALKMLFDNSSPHRIWWNKQALLTGVSTGRAGNLRGMDHLTGVLNYLKITVHPNKLPISVVNQLFGADDKLHDNNTLAAIEQQLNEFIIWNNKNVKY